MKEKKSIQDLMQEAVDTMLKYGNTPHAIICSKKTWEKVALYFRKQSRIEEKFMPLQVWFKYEGGDLPVLKFKHSPDDRIDVLDKDTYEHLMKENVKPFIYKRRGLYYDFGKKTIIKRIG